MALPIVPGSLPANQIDTAINDTRGYIEDGPTHWDSGVTVPVAQGGTGATTAAAARTALGLPVLSAPGIATANGLAVFGPNSRLQVQDPTQPSDAATKFYVDNAVGSGGSYLPLAGGTVTGQLLLPNSYAADSGYTVCYINGNGRVSRGASSERFKTDIEYIDPASLGDLFPQLSSFVMKDDPGKMTRYGYIAERLAEVESLAPFVVHEREPVYEQLDVLDEDGRVIGTQQGEVIGSRRVLDKDGEPIPLSIDFIALGIAQNAQLDQRDRAREAEVAALRAEVAELRALVEALK